MPPAVAPAPQMRRPGPPIRRQCRRHLSYSQPSDGRLHHHLRSELHARRLKVKVEHGVAVETPQAAMEVATGGMEKQPADGGQDRIAEVAMEWRHRAGGDAALETISHDQRVPFAQSGDKVVEPAEVIAVVGIAHDDKTAARGADPAQKGAAISLFGHRNDTCARGCGDLLRTV